MAIHFDQRTLLAYLASDYILNENDGIFQIGALHKNEERIFVEKGLISYAWITAWNPQSVELGYMENQIRNKELELDLQTHLYFGGMSRSPDGNWEEEGYWVGNMELEDIRKVGRKFGQNAIVHARPGNALKLILL